MAEKSVGQWVGTIVGAVVGYFTAGAGYAAVAGSMASGAAVGGAIGGIIDPPKGPNLYGPRLGDLSVQTATYGAVIPRVYGTVALLGNVFWLENNQIKENVKNEGGGKGGGDPETTTYNYSATFAVGLCQGPIDGVRRIWVGAKLIYDAGSDDIKAIMVSNTAAELFTVHTGSDTQPPDDRMQAALGVANTPAYRGLAYIVLKDYPLADHGNSLLGAQVKVEVVREGAVVDNLVSTDVVGTDVGPYAVAASGDFAYVANNNAASVNIFRVNDPSRLQLTGSVTTTGNPVSIIESNGFLYVGNQFGTSIQVINISNENSPAIVAAVDIAGNGLLCLDVFEDRLYVTDTTDDTLKVFSGLPLSPTLIGSIPTGLSPRGVHHADGYVYVANYHSNTLQVFDISGLLPELIATVAATGNPIAVFVDNGIACVLGYTGYTLQMFDVSIPTAPVLVGSIGVDIRPIGVAVRDGLAYIVHYTAETLWIVDISNPAAPSVMATEGTDGVPAGVALSNDLICVANRTSDTLETFCFYSSIAATTVPLSAIVQAECLQSGILDASDLDVTGLTQAVRGYRVSSVAAIRSAIEPLQGAWPFDVIQAGYKIKFKPRGSAVVATIPATDLDAREAGKAGGVSINASREMDSILPCRVVLKHIDVSREYDMGEQYAERLNTAAVNIQTVEMPIVMTGGEAAGNAEMLLYLYWLERYDISFTLPPTYNHLEPGDVITVNATSATYELRLTAITYTSDGRLECAAKYNSAAVYLPTALGEEGQSTGQTLAITGPTAYELLDIPLLLDATDMPGFPVAMSGYMAGWPGGILYRSDDAGQTWSGLQSFTAPGCVIGTAGAPLAVGQTSLIDKAGVLSVTLISGSLSSVSESAMLNGSNHFAYGAHGRWEIIAAQNCTLQGDGSYVLTDLLRGRFGSEWACGLHVTGDRIVFLDASSLAFVTANINTVGMARTYRGITSGKGISTDRDRAFTYAGVNLECLSPVYLNGNRHPTTNDWSLDWIRRTRVGGEWRDYVDATLGEAAQSYEVEIYSSAAYTTLKRTISSLTTPAASYTSANQVTDFGSNQATLYVKAYQLSANVGRGYPLTTSITR